MPSGVLDEIEESITKGKYRSRTDAIINLTKKGLELEALIEINKDPKKKKQFEQNLKELLTQDSIEHVLETVSDETLDAILSYAGIMKERRFHQALISIR